jgi:hypothetical protein
MGDHPGPRARRSISTEREVQRRQDADRRSIFTVLDGLLREIDTLDLDAIDGEFFFRCCRPDFDERVAELRAELANFESEESWVPRLYDAALDLHQHDLVPFEVAWGYLHDVTRLHLRTPEIMVGQGDDLAYDHVSLKVFSQAWTGDHVARSLLAGFHRYQQTWGWSPRRSPSVPTASFRFTSRLVNGDDLSQWRGGIVAAGGDWWEHVSDGEGGHVERRRDPQGAPYVEVTVGLPLPPVEAIVCAYDTIVRKQHAWHLRLPGASAQDKMVALRTWTIALLMKTGLRFGPANGEWCRRASIPAEITDKRFYQDRDRLLSRVPEAMACLAVRRRSPLPPPTPDSP